MVYLKVRGKKNSILRILVVTAVIAVVSCAFSLYQSKYFLEISHYEIHSEKVKTPIRIVQLSDLHNSVFGKDNSDLIRAVAEQEPDIILLTGDMLNFDEAEYATASLVTEKLSEIAPVYFSYGNHEIAYEQRYGLDLTQVFEEAGARVLDFAYEDLECRGQSIRLGGIFGYCLPDLEGKDLWPEETKFLKNFQNTDKLTVLMCHMPVSWMDYGSLESWQVDVIFSGHAHGGQVRLPLIGGLYAPDQEWFPGREEGLYDSKDGERTLVLSRGLGSSTLIPRFNNRPELVTVDIVPD